MLDTYTPIKYLQDKDVVKQVFMISHISYHHDEKFNEDYARLTLKDVTGEIHGRIYGCKKSKLNVYDFVNVEIKVMQDGHRVSFLATPSSFYGRLKNKPVNIHDYIPSMSSSKIEDYISKLHEYIELISNPEHRNIIGNALSERTNLITMLKNSPYETHGPLACPGGLLIHIVDTLSYVNMAYRQSNEKLDLSFMILGTILKEIGWYEIASFNDTAVLLNDSYKMMGLDGASLRIMNTIIYNTEEDIRLNISDELKLALRNLFYYIQTAEGKVISLASSLAKEVSVLSDKLNKKQNENWINGIFTGHY
jgi:hypothetical protein